MVAHSELTFPYTLHPYDCELPEYLIMPTGTATSSVPAAKLEFEFSRLAKISGASVYDVSHYTDKILKNSFIQSPFPNGTLVFLPGLESRYQFSYLWGPIEPEAIRVISADYRHEQSLQSRFLDKVTQRQLAAEIGIFPQPEWHDLRSLRLEPQHVVRFSQIRFDNLPVSQLFASESSTNVILFDTIEDGFALVRAPNGGVFIISQNPVIHEIAALQKQAPKSAAEIANFLINLQESPYVLEKYVHGSSLSSYAATRQAILALDSGTWYLKGSHGSGADEVARITLQSGQLLSFEQPMAIEKKLFSSKLNAEQKLARALNGRMLLPYIEREIPPGPLDHLLRTEVRCVFIQQEGRVEFLFMYTKTSNDPIAANISQGGTGEPTSVTVSRFVNLFPDEKLVVNENHVQLELDALRLKAQSFSDRFVALRSERELPGSSVFALDLKPVINEKSDGIDYWLIEIQDYPAVSGAFGNISEDELSRARTLWPEIDTRSSL